MQVDLAGLRQNSILFIQEWSQTEKARAELIIIKLIFFIITIGLIIVSFKNGHSS